MASIAVGNHSEESSMLGIAPECTFLPIRVGFGGATTQIAMVHILNYVSQHADVVNCSFGYPPHTADIIHPSTRAEITQLTKTGGRRGKGLVMVFSAGNDDAPTFMHGHDNVNGVFYTSDRQMKSINAGRNVFSGYPMIEGVVVVASMSSQKRKSGYSSWGPHVTVAAPSDNLHYINEFVAPDTDPNQSLFNASYPGLGQVAAINRPMRGAPFDPISYFDNPLTEDIIENYYTKGFGGTSGAAPVVTGVVALMLSVNPDLTAAQVREILMSTADKDLDPNLDLASDPNVQGLTGEFINGRSRWFGAGKVDAFRALVRARALSSPSKSLLKSQKKRMIGAPQRLPATQMLERLNQRMNQLEEQLDLYEAKKNFDKYITPQLDMTAVKFTKVEGPNLSRLFIGTKEILSPHDSEKTVLLPTNTDIWLRLEVQGDVGDKAVIEISGAHPNTMSADVLVAGKPREVLMPIKVIAKERLL